MTDYENVPFEEAAMLLHIVEGAARVQGLQSLSGAALTRLKEIDGECLNEAKALASAKADQAAVVNQARLRTDADVNNAAMTDRDQDGDGIEDSLEDVNDPDGLPATGTTLGTTTKVIPSTTPIITENNRRV